MAFNSRAISPAPFYALLKAPQYSGAIVLVQPAQIEPRHGRLQATRTLNFPGFFSNAAASKYSVSQIRRCISAPRPLPMNDRACPEERKRRTGQAAAALESFFKSRDARVRVPKRGTAVICGCERGAYGVVFVKRSTESSRRMSSVAAIAIVSLSMLRCPARIARLPGFGRSGSAGGQRGRESDIRAPRSVSEFA